MRFPKRRGFTLVASIMLIVFAAMVVLGVTTFIIQRLEQNEVNRRRTRVIYLAQAGLHDALYWYRQHDLTVNGYFSLGQVSIDADNYFVRGGTEADLLMVNTSGSYLDPPGMGRNRFRNLQGLIMQNAVDNKLITVDRMVVTWDNDNHLRRIFIDGSRVWQGRSLSPADCNISDVTLDTDTTIIDRLQFDGDMSGATIGIEFVMADSTSKTLSVYPAWENYSFTVKTTGKTSGADFYRTIEADYNALTAKITRYREIDTEITP